MPRFLECLLCDDGTINSPGVGRFSPCAPGNVPNPQLQPFGTLMRLGQCITLCIPARILNFHILVPEATSVAVGDVLGSFHLDSRPVCSSDSCHQMFAPADGFIQFGNVEQIKKSPGDELCPGEVVATLEFMKIRMEIIFDGPANSLLKQYLGLDHRAVKRGEPFLEYTPDESNS